MASSTSCKYENLAVALASLDDFRVGIDELQTLLLQMPHTCLVSDLGKLISLIETAKATLVHNGVSLHTFASCPARLVPHKTAYFSFLTQLREHTRHVRFTSDNTDVRVRLSHLLFPLSTQLKFRKISAPLEYRLPSPQKVYSLKFPDKSSRNEARKVSSLPTLNHIIHSESALRQRSAPPLRNLYTTASTIPDNVMLPPPAPLHCARSPPKCLERSNNLVPAVWKCGDERDEPPKALPSARTAASVRRASHRQSPQLKRKRPYGDIPSCRAVASPPSSEDEEEDSSTEEKASDGSGSDNSESSSDREDEDSDHESKSEEDGGGDGDEDDNVSMDHGRSAKLARIVVPERSPLRRSFGIFCTGKGHGAFNGTVPLRPPRPSLTRRNTQFLRSPRS